MVEAPQTTGAGRPRDATIEDRVFDEAIRQFGKLGWSRLSIDKIASAIGVGKASIYLRWGSKEELLIDALEQRVPRAFGADTGSLWGDMREMLTEILDLYTSDIGDAVQRFVMDTDFSPELAELLATHRAKGLEAWRQMVRRNIDRGWLKPDISIGFLLNVVHGGIWSYATTGNPSPREERSPERDARFIDLMLRLIQREFAAVPGPADNGA